MTTFINGTDIVFTNNSSNSIITLKASSGKTLVIEGYSTGSDSSTKIYGHVSGNGEYYINDNTQEYLLDGVYWSGTVTTQGSISYTNGSFTVSKAGIYSVTASIIFAGDGTGYRQCHITVNDDTSGSKRYGFNFVSSINGFDSPVVMASNLKLQAGDKVSIYVYTTTDYPVGMGSSIHSHFAIAEI